MLLAQASKESGRKCIASAGRIHNLDWRSRNIVTLALADDDSALFTPRDDSQLSFCSNLTQSVFEISRFLQRQKLGFVGKENIDVTGNEPTECRVMTANAERV